MDDEDEIECRVLFRLILADDRCMYNGTKE